CSPSARAVSFTHNRTTAGTPINANGFSCPSGAAVSVCTVSSILSFGGLPFTIDPTIQSRIISKLPTASNFTGGDNLNTAGYAFNPRFDEDRPTYTTRIDLDVNEKNSINGVFSYTKDS